MPSQTQRGVYLERQLNNLLTHLGNVYGAYGHKNHAFRAIDGRFLQGEPFDYEILYKNKLYCFDAKECKQSRWNLSNAKIGQLNALMACKKNGADAFFLVYFWKTNQLIKYDVEKVCKALEAKKASLTPEEGEVWTWEEIVSK